MLPELILPNFNEWAKLGDIHNHSLSTKWGNCSLKGKDHKFSCRIPITKPPLFTFRLFGRWPYPERVTEVLWSVCVWTSMFHWFTRSQTKNTTISLKILWGCNYSNTTITRWHWNITGILALGVGQWTKCAEAASWCCAAGGSASRRVHFWSGLEVKCARFLILSDYKTFHLSRIHEAGKLLHCIFLLCISFFQSFIAFSHFIFGLYLFLCLWLCISHLHSLIKHERCRNTYTCRSSAWLCHEGFFANVTMPALSDTVQIVRLLLCNCAVWGMTRLLLPPYTHVQV